eukprot:3634186-Ditylum_brightwellii.AAC.2
MDATETSTTETPTPITAKVGTAEGSIAGLMDTVTIQVQIVNKRCKAIKMRPYFKTEWEVVQGDTNDG